MRARLKAFWLKLRNLVYPKPLDSAPPSANSAVLQQLISPDANDVVSGCQAVAWSRDFEELALLAENLDLIRARTSGRALGGHFFRFEDVYLKFALQKLEWVKNNKGCLCGTYPDYMFFDPKTEEKNGHIRIDEIRRIEDKWVDYYACTCTTCGAAYRVKEGESHYVWWDWMRAPDPLV